MSIETEEAVFKTLFRAAVCFVCKKPANTQCSGCHHVKYCSPECQKVDWKRSHKAKCRAWRGIATVDELFALVKTAPFTMLHAQFWRMNAEAIEMRADEFVAIVRDNVQTIETDTKLLAASQNMDPVPGPVYKAFFNNLPIVVRYTIINGGRYIITPSCRCERCIAGRDYKRVEQQFKSTPLASFFGWNV
jgi:hypothetical protein